MVKCIIIDDQTDAIELLTDHVKSRNELQLLGSFTNPLEALTFLEKNPLDLVFIDIKMPYLNGLEFIESLRAKHGNNLPDFILTTGFDKYSLPGFEQGAVDYLLKPIGEKRFKIAMDRFFNRRLKCSGTKEKKDEYFFADLNGKKQKIEFKEVVYLKSAGNYISVFGENNLMTIIYNSMNGAQEIFPTENFIRVHKSYAISINHIHAIKGRELLMKRNGSIVNVPIGASFKNEIFKRLKINQKSKI
jgi:DNA-binding LytR/AlgR family response regulator